jgi:hypothetical protein
MNGLLSDGLRYIAAHGLKFAHEICMLVLQ